MDVKEAKEAKAKKKEKFITQMKENYASTNTNTIFVKLKSGETHISGSNQHNESNIDRLQSEILTQGQSLVEDCVSDDKNASLNKSKLMVLAAAYDYLEEAQANKREKHWETNPRGLNETKKLVKNLIKLQN